MKVYVVCTGSGYYASSVWSTREGALAELKRLGEGPARVSEHFPAETIDRYVQEWEVDKPEQHWAEMNRKEEQGWPEPAPLPPDYWETAE